MFIYFLIILSGILVLKEVKSNQNRKKVILAYIAVLSIGFFYNLGEITGEFLYNIGFTL